MRLTAPSHLFHRSLDCQPPRIAALLAIATALALPVAAFGQQAPTGSDDTDAAMRNIQNNFAHMTPAPRTIDTINQELKQTAKARGGGGGGGFGQRGGGRHGGRQASQQDKSTDSSNGAGPGTGATPPESPALSNGAAAQ
ncbi:MAG: hypothetical protein JO067_08880 [Cupriavidus sp.]|nr:hypothetical protein [Cupriavidus sp.]